MEFSNPTCGTLGLLIVKQLGVEDTVERDLASRGGDDFSTGVEGRDDCFNLVGLLFVDQVKLVQNDDIGEFDLVDQQVGHGAIVLLTEGFTTGLKRFGFVVVLEETVGVHDRNHRVET